MDAEQIRDRAEAALTKAGFFVRENDEGIPRDTPFPGGVCLFVQQDQARVYLYPFEFSLEKKSEAAKLAPEALAGEGLQVRALAGESPENELTAADRLLGGTCALEG
ncbi:hypothetical protein [Microbispora sp. H10885]|uniref:hypothetical protein n=1 Tax=Microbispora sp. H10885 TaxID=2729110 RepID=UPI001601CCF1|nr:hypothetical protein [Microbispora sp. H10885]